MIEGCGKFLMWFESWNWKAQSIPSQQIASQATMPIDAWTSAAPNSGPISEPEKKGTFWGWLGCKFSGMNFTGGGVYDDYTGECTIKGEFMRVLHGR